MAVKMLGWVMKRWHEVIEPAARTATVEQEAALREVWAQELAYWKQSRRIDGDSLRNPITQVRADCRAAP